jgi:hypothetical protein
MATKVRPASGIGNAKAVAGPHGASVPLTKAAHNISSTDFSGVHAAGSALGAGNGTALPWDNIAEGQVATAQKTGIDTKTQIAANRALGLSEFGLDPGYDDPKANPYSQAAILQHNHESNARGINVTAGQALYSGQTGNAQTIEQGRTNQAHQGLVNEENQAKARWLGEEKAAEHREEEEINSAKEGAVQRGIESNHPEVPLPEGGGGNNGGGQQKEKIPYPAPPKKKWEWNGSHWHLVKA